MSVICDAKCGRCLLPTARTNTKLRHGGEIRVFVTNCRWCMLLSVGLGTRNSEQVGRASRPRYIYLQSHPSEFIFVCLYARTMPWNWLFGAGEREVAHQEDLVESTPPVSQETDEEDAEEVRTDFRSQNIIIGIDYGTTYTGT